MVNKVILIGYAAAPAELRTLESGVAMARLRVATSENIYNHTTGQSSQITQWHNIVMWRNTAQYAARFIEKGSQVYIEGRLRNRPVVIDSVEKQGVTTYEILADTLHVLGKKNTTQTTSEDAPQVNPQATSPISSPTTETQTQQSTNTFQSIAQLKDPDDIPF